ncbi:MAG: hypothetical protein ACFFCS_07600 [Candidatus Hodarchaeota archaeon]
MVSPKLPRSVNNQAYGCSLPGLAGFTCNVLQLSYKSCQQATHRPGLGFIAIERTRLDTSMGLGTNLGPPKCICGHCSMANHRSTNPTPIIVNEKKEFKDSRKAMD